MTAGITPQPIITTTGSYTGDGTVNKAIAHGLGRNPVLVVIMSGSAFMEKSGQITELGGPNSNAVTAWTSTNFYVGNATSYINSANNSGTSYYWVAM